MPLEGELSPSRMGHHRRMCVTLHTPLHPTQAPASPCNRKTVCLETTLEQILELAATPS